MRSATEVKNNFIPDVKVTLLGNRKVGKTALMKKWVQNVFSATTPTTGLDQEFKNLKVFPNVSVNLALFEIAGNQSPLPMQLTNPRSAVDTHKVFDFNVSLFKGTKLFFIVVSTESTEEERINQIKIYKDQIKSWQQLKYGKNVYEDIKVLVIENKFEQGNYLTAEQLSQIGVNKSEDYVALSVKHDSFSELEKIVNNILPHLIPETPQCPPLAGVMKINDKQADRVLNFVENMIRQGTTHDNRKPFKVGLFGLGGKAYEYKSNTAENDNENQTAIMPNHVVNLLKNIDTNKSKKSSKEILIDIYQQSLQIVDDEPSATRQTSTQTFYAKTLPEYILRSVQPATNAIHTNIYSLQNDRAKEILQIVKQRLLEGVTNHSNNPYDVSFFGGNMYKYEGKIIKLPQHVALLIARIDQCVSKNNNETARQVLSEIYQNIIQAQLMPNDCRREATQEFYDEILPHYIVELIELPSTRVNACPDKYCVIKCV